MKAIALNSSGPIESTPLKVAERALPHPGAGEILLQVQACGLCHTDLHIVEGDITPPALPLIPGHQVVGRVEAIGEDVQGWSIGDYGGVPWLYAACGECSYCLRGEQNLCDAAQFTGFDRDGGYAEWIISRANFTLKIPENLGAEETAPLLCAGIIGYRSLRLAELRPGERLGLIGFGASAHIAIQLARHWDCEVYVFTRSPAHRLLAEELGAHWVGGIEQDPSVQIDRAVLFAPVGALVAPCLGKLRKGGTLAINAIHMSPIPEMDYQALYGERTLRSVTNATFQDGVELLDLAAQIPVQTRTTRYRLDEANEALLALKHSRINGAGVLIP